MPPTKAAWRQAGNLPQKEPVSVERINRLIKQLGDKDYYVRQRAQDELARLGFEAFDALNAATTNEDLEIASRAKYLLRLMRVEWTAESDPPEVKRCLHDYEFEDPRSREAKMRALAALPDGQGIAALCRLVRFEKSLLLSKSAAVALLSSQIDRRPAQRRRDRNGAQESGRLQAAGRRVAVGVDAAGQRARSGHGRVDQADRRRAEAGSARRPTRPAPEIVAGLTRFQIARLKKLGKTDEAMAAIRRLVDLERGNPETLAELLEWLVEQKAWKAVDELAQRFAAQFAVEPGLLYTLAQAYAEQGQKDRAEETAARAFHLYPGKQQKQLLRHLMVAQHLRERGQFAWARREFEHVIEQGSDADNDEIRAMAQSVLAEMLHDQGQDLDAAEALEKLVQTIDAGQVTEDELNGRKPSEVRSRMHYFFACHWETKGDAAKQRQALDKALKADPTDVDVLIACYRLPEQTPEYHAKIVDLIKKAAAATREQIAEDPESPSPTTSSPG